MYNNNVTIQGMLIFCGLFNISKLLIFYFPWHDSPWTEIEGTNDVQCLIQKILSEWVNIIHQVLKNYQ